MIPRSIPMRSKRIPGAGRRCFIVADGSAPQAALWGALKKMNRDGVNQLPDLPDGSPVGILTREDVISFMRTVREPYAQHVRLTSTPVRTSSRAVP